MVPPLAPSTYATLVSQNNEWTGRHVGIPNYYCGSWSFTIFYPNKFVSLMAMWKKRFISNLDPRVFSFSNMAVLG